MIALYYIRGLILAKMKKEQKAENSLRIAQKIRENVFGVDAKTDSATLKCEIEVLSAFNMWKHKEVLKATKAYFL